MTCWPEDAAPLITGVDGNPRAAQRAAEHGIYRQQLIGKNKLIMRWLSHRGGALDFRSGARRVRANASRFPWRLAPIRQPFLAR